ncbi:hypothetical protein BHE74_00050653 [Ensete ventricosum]|nr:hypothetical protein GW17_00043665 [Ensete ventricosum]RWW43652.1 hypothetical protein BHE74_00050653 [Ensete ventricosum]RZS17250.1 hypothetical protein BHM03_00049368 [Ensete ventricosum]
MTDLCDFFQLQALVGVDKTIKHSDEHLVENGTKGITKPKDVRKFHFPSRQPVISNTMIKTKLSYKKHLLSFSPWL